MGYSEIPCRICGVSFNISRIRTRGERQSEAFRCTGDGKYPGFVDTTGDEACVATGGCLITKRIVERRAVFSSERENTEAFLNEDGDDEADSDYVQESADEDEYEYESDDDRHVDAIESEDIAMDDVGEDRAQGDWREFLLGNAAFQKGGETSQEDIFLPMEYLNKLEHSDQDKSKNGRHEVLYEHIAGQSCKNHRGYNGHNITAQEMRGCNTFQCLVHELHSKELDVKESDLDYERDSHYFFSGLGNQMKSRDTGGHSTLLPTRHGVDGIPIDNIPWDFLGQREEYSMPFHPACFDIFARLSRRHFAGKVDVDGLMSWYILEHSYDDVYSFPHHPDVKKSSLQWWEYNSGHEYLAANPLFVPTLEEILGSVVETDPNFSTQLKAYAMYEKFTTGSIGDIFNTLPEELKFEVLGYLPSKDIANLRLASRKFRQLPILLWRKLLREEMPWLWEVGTTDEPFKWATVSYDHLQHDKAERDAVQTEIAAIHTIIREELPELLDAWKEGERALIASRPDIVLESYETALKSRIWSLPATQTNWFELYTRITRQWSELKGLQNRARIWKDVEEIISRIQKYRDEGKIVD